MAKTLLLIHSLTHTHTVDAHSDYLRDSDGNLNAKSTGEGGHLYQSFEVIQMLGQLKGQQM